jgi:hypothetical protein
MKRNCYPLDTFVADDVVVCVKLNHLCSTAALLTQLLPRRRSVTVYISNNLHVLSALDTCFDLHSCFGLGSCLKHSK